jgi:hypothetical protein
MLLLVASACGKSEPTAPVTIRFVKMASPGAGPLVDPTWDATATANHSITFTPRALAYPIERVEFLPEPGDGKGIAFDGTAMLRVLPGGVGETVLTLPAGDVAPGTYDGLRVVFADADSRAFTARIEAVFQIGGTSFVTGPAGLVASSGVDPVELPVTIASSRAETTFAQPVTLTEDQPVTVTVFFDPTHLARAGGGGADGSRIWTKECTGTFDEGLNVVTSGPFVCAGIPRFVATAEDVEPVVERYHLNSVIHACNPDGSDDPVDDWHAAKSAIYSLYFHPITGAFLGGVAARYAREGEEPSGEPVEAGYVERLGANGEGSYELVCADHGGPTGTADCRYATFRRETHGGRYSNRNAECYGYDATRL